MRTGDGRDLPQRLRGEIEREFRRLDNSCSNKVAATEAERDAAVANPAVADADAEKVTRAGRLWWHRYRTGHGSGARGAGYRRSPTASRWPPTPPHAEPVRQRRPAARRGHLQGRNPLLRKSMVELAWLCCAISGQRPRPRFVERVGTGRGASQDHGGRAGAQELLVALWPTSPPGWFRRARA